MTREDRDWFLRRMIRQIDMEKKAAEEG